MHLLVDFWPKPVFVFDKDQRWCNILAPMSNETKSIFEEQISRKPDRYPWVQEYISVMHEGFWTHKEFSFSSDVQDFKVNLSEEEKAIIVKTLSAIGQIEVAVKKFWAKLGDNLPHPSLTDLGYVMAGVEVIHNNAYQRLLEVLGMEDIFEENLKLDVVLGRVNYLRKYNHKFYKDSRKQYVYALILFTLFIENVSLFSQFYIILWFGRFRNVLKDTTQQVTYTKNEECYVEGTEILTAQGWKKISEISVGDEVFQYEDDFTFSIAPVVNTICKEINENIISFERKQNKCSVTKDHDMVLFKKGALQKVKAKDVKIHNETRFPVKGVFKNQGSSEISFEERLRFAIQADGTALYWENKDGEKILRGKDGGYTHSFGLTKKRKQDRLRWILKEGGFSYEEQSINNSGEIQFKVRYNQDFDYKKLSWINIKEKNSDWCLSAVEEIVEWDGFKEGKHIGYCSIDKSNIDIVQMIAILAGFTTSLYEGNESERGFANCWKLSVMNSDLAPRSHSVKKTETHYSGNVYCVTVPSGKIMTRLDNKTFISGNCVHALVGMKLVNTIRQEHPELFDEELEARILNEAGEAFKAESKIIDWIIGDWKDKRISAEVLKEYIKSRINDSLKEIGFRQLFSIDESLARDFEWMDEEVLANNAVDFFYQRPVDYAKANKTFELEDLV